MVIIKRQHIGTIPCLFITTKDNIEKRLPTVIYMHGFNGEKDANLTIAYRLAEKGYRTILFDSLYHGERQADIAQAKKELAFWHIVKQNIADLEAIRNYIIQHHLLLEHRIGIGGASMGGIASYGALVTYDWVDVLAVAMATPQLTSFAELLMAEVSNETEYHIDEKDKQAAFQMVKQIDITLHPDLINEKHIFAWHGELDNVIPVKHTTDFFAKIKSDHCRLIVEEERMHHVSRLAIEETVTWLHAHV